MHSIKPTKNIYITALWNRDLVILVGFLCGCHQIKRCFCILAFLFKNQLVPTFFFSFFFQNTKYYYCFLFKLTSSHNYCMGPTLHGSKEEKALFLQVTNYRISGWSGSVFGSTCI